MKLDWAALWLVKYIFSTVWVQVRTFEENVHISQIWVFFESSQNCRQMTATPRRSILHAAKSSQMPYNAQINVSCILLIKLNISLEGQQVYRAREEFADLTKSEVRQNGVLVASYRLGPQLWLRLPSTRRMQQEHDDSSERSHPWIFSTCILSCWTFLINI
jgi:hypothetical protein